MKEHRLRGEIKKILSSHNRVTIPSEGHHIAGVLLVFYRKNTSLNLLLTRRSMSVAIHRGEISFPGGTFEDRDQSLVQTALRETYEEVGIRVPQTDVIGALDDVWTVKSDYIITPYLVMLDFPPSVSTNSEEIHEVLEIPIRELLRPKILGVKRVGTTAGFKRTYAYRYLDYEIWGATAKILKQFLDLLTVNSNLVSAL